LGLYDMSGNVWEWVQDCYDNTNEEKCGRRVIRGSSWLNLPVDLRTSSRLWLVVDDRTNLIGFRLAQDLP
ncbi:MAG: formylglycine-generating enzyme family protein, partial [Nitrospiraceae bacterium]